MAAAVVIRASHRATRVTAALAAVLTSLPREIRDIDGSSLDYFEISGRV